MGEKMILKKTNAVLGLLSSIAVVVHMVYNCFSYFTFYYNPALKLATSVPLMVLVCAHAICGMCSVFLLGDGTRLDLYPQKNRKTIIQRISAALIFPLLIVHLDRLCHVAGTAASFLCGYHGAYVHIFFQSMYHIGTSY